MGISHHMLLLFFSINMLGMVVLAYLSCLKERISKRKAYQIVKKTVTRNNITRPRDIFSLTRNLSSINLIINRINNDIDKNIKFECLVDRAIPNKTAKFNKFFIVFFYK